MSGHGGLDDFQRLAQRGDLEHVQTRAEEQVAELDGLLLNLLHRGRGRHHCWSGHRTSVGDIVCPDQGRSSASSP